MSTSSNAAVASATKDFMSLWQSAEAVLGCHVDIISTTYYPKIKTVSYSLTY